MSVERRSQGLGVLATMVAVAVVIATASGMTAGAQEQQLQILGVDPSAHPSVRMTVAAPEEFDGEELSAESFALTENGDRAELTVARDTQQVDVVLVIDVSGSMAGAPIAAAITAAGTFIDRVDDSARVAVVTFGDTVSQPVALTEDHQSARAALGGLGATGETALYDGIQAGAAAFDESFNRRVMVVLSDGKDTSSTATAPATANALRAANASLFTIPLQGAESDFAALQSLTAAAGGRWIPADDPSALEAAYGEVAVRLNNRWVLMWESGKHGPVDLAVSVAFDNEVAVARSSVDFASPAAGPADDAVVASPDTGDFAVSTVDGSWLDTWGRPLGLIAIGGAIVAAFVALRSSRKMPKRRLSTELGVREERPKPTFVLRELADFASTKAEELLERRHQRSGIDDLLDRASINMRPGEFVVFTGGFSLLAFIVGALLGSIFLGALGAGVVVLCCVGWVQRKARKRSDQFVDALDGALLTLANSLRAGHGLPQALDTVARETDGPISEEFARVVMEARLGRDVVDSLAGVDQRMGDSDFSWVVKAVSIHRELGGDLSEVLDNVSATIRDRNRIRAQIKALSAEGRLSGLVLFLLPVAMTVFMLVTRPSYFNDMIDSTLGQAFIVGGIVAMVIGAVWIRRIVKLRF